MIKKIISKLFGFEKELKAKDLKIELRESEIKDTEKELKNTKDELRTATDKIYDLETKITDLKKDLKVESSQKNEAISLATVRRTLLNSSVRSSQN